jgi:hypothetical protein
MSGFAGLARSRRLAFASFLRGTTLGASLLVCFMAGLLLETPASAQPDDPIPMEISSGWQVQDSAKVSDKGDAISQPGYNSTGWNAATVPGTVLTSLVNDKIYPEPLYGENNRPDIIPESLCHTSYWYRTGFTVPAEDAGRKVWLNFDGINYQAEVWVNGTDLGSIKGAFARGRFEITSVAAAGKAAALAVEITPQPHPGVPLEQTIRNGTGHNGGITAIDGPTFLCTIGWDWIPGIRDRDTGIWQKVFLSATGPVTIRNPYIRTTLPLPRTDSAELSVEVTLQNVDGAAKSGVLTGNWGDGSFSKAITLQPNETRVVKITSRDAPALHLDHPRLWWPNGYGPQNLYTMKLRFDTEDKALSDEQEVTFGVRQFAYAVASSPNLTVSCNGVPIFCKGGDWGMDEAMKRNPRARLEAEIKMHQLANYNIVRNWVGQSTSQDFYELCDKYGIMIWDEFFQPNPSDGPNPTDIPLYMANVWEKILRFRSHPSILLWCARNEGYPPPEIDAQLRSLLDELEGSRLYQPSSTAGRGVHSGGPYYWRTPREFYHIDAPFKTEIGSVSVPTLESIHGFMPAKDWESINDDWASHDFCRGAQGGDHYPGQLAARYGALVNLPDFVRKAQLANYEAFRAMYEGRECAMFSQSTGVITWMSHPAQPSFVWQLYCYDLEPNASLFAVRKACEPVHVMMNEATGHVAVINNLSASFEGRAKVTLYNLDGAKKGDQAFKVSAAPTAPLDLGPIEWPTDLTPVHFVKVELDNAKGKLVSDNFYWRVAPPLPKQAENFQDLNKLEPVKLQVALKRHDAPGKVLIDVTLRNPTDKVALMAHLQLRRKSSGERVLPVYYTDNYISLVPGEAKTVTIEAAAGDLKGDLPYVTLDGWNVSAAPAATAEVAFADNGDALVSSVPSHDFKIVPGN